MLLAGVVMASLILTGCTTVVVAPAPTEPAAPVVVEPAETAAQPEADPEAEYLELFKKEAPIAYASSSDKELVALGYTVCIKLDEGWTTEEVMQSLVDVGADDARLVAAAVYGALTFLCPP